MQGVAAGYAFKHTPFGSQVRALTGSLLTGSRLGGSESGRFRSPEMLVILSLISAQSGVGGTSVTPLLVTMRNVWEQGLHSRVSKPCCWSQAVWYDAEAQMLVPGCEVLLPPGQHALPSVAASLRQGGRKIVAVSYGQHALPSVATSLRQGGCKCYMDSMHSLAWPQGRGVAKLLLYCLKSMHSLAWPQA